MALTFANVPTGADRGLQDAVGSGELAAAGLAVIGCDSKFEHDFLQPLLYS